MNSLKDHLNLIKATTPDENTHMHKPWSILFGEASDVKVITPYEIAKCHSEALQAIIEEILKTKKNEPSEDQKIKCIEATRESVKDYIKVALECMHKNDLNQAKICLKAALSIRYCENFKCPDHKNDQD